MRTTSSTRVSALELHRREVHRELDRARPFGAPPRKPLRSTHTPISLIRPISSASGMNSSGGTRPRTGCFQRNERLEAADRVRFHVDQRLEVDHELVVRQRRAQVEFEQPAHLQRGRPFPARRSCMFRVLRPSTGTSPCPRTSADDRVRIRHAAPGKFRRLRR